VNSGTILGILEQEVGYGVVSMAIASCRNFDIDGLSAARIGKTDLGFPQIERSSLFIFPFFWLLRKTISTVNLLYRIV